MSRASVRRWLVAALSAALVFTTACPPPADSSAQQGDGTATDGASGDGSAVDGSGADGAAADGTNGGDAGGSAAPAGLLEVPDPRSGDNPRYALVAAPTPEPGGSTADSRFGTSQTRVVGGEGLRHEYSRFDPFNRDGTLILLLAIAGEWRIYRTQSVPYDRDGSLVRIVEVAEPRWDPENPDVLWGLRAFQVVRASAASGEITVVKDFALDAQIAPILAANPDLYRITTREEGETSLDKRFWAFMLQGSADDYRPRYLFTWDREEDRVLGVYALSLAESRIDWVGMSPLGNWVVVGADWDNGGGKSGMLIADREFAQFRQIDYDAGHSDVGLDSAGNEVLVLQSNRTDSLDMVALGAETVPVEAGQSYAGTGRVQLVRLFYDSASPLGLRSGVHISCNAPGWCVISTFSEPDAPEQNWLDRTITLARLDAAAPRVFYVAKVHGTAGAYWEETQASLSADGARVVWATNWGQNVGQDRVWLMQTNLPTAWMAAFQE
ncbi:MAG: hypothetical protein HRF50_17495 [Phycisphaerae bacterium]|jgi:hypothetical protein